MRHLRNAAAASALAIAATGLAGCSVAPKLFSFLHLRSSPPALKIRPVTTASLTPPDIKPLDRIYQDAKGAIEVRDYARALDLLQFARQEAPDDGRILNALGVVYDKLGRFDLSARYYQLALAKEPKSPVVLANMQYSAKLQHFAEALRTTNLAANAAAAPVSPADRPYAMAKQAIQGGDYGRALDLLQIAKQQAPNDERVLNAIGVVYDKLGRFDLSARYYQLALAAKPNSPVVMANMEYSAKLQAHPGGADAPAPVATPATLQAEAAGPLLVGSSLVVVNATGRSGVEDKVRRRLALAGWTVSSRDRAEPSRKDTVIRFEPQHRRVAEALAHTLPFEVKLQACDAQACPGVELLLGADARAKGWS